MPDDMQLATAPDSVKILRGSFEGSGISIAHVGRNEHSRYLVPYLRTLIDDPTLENFSLSTKGVGPDAGELCPRQADIFFRDAEVHGYGAGFMDDAPSFLMPFRVHFVSDVRNGLESLARDMSRDKRKKHRQRVRKYGYTYTVSTDEAEFLDFYDRMYAPTMEHRPGDSARSVARPEALKLFREGMLVLVRKGGIIQSGIACQIVRDRSLINARLLGVPGGDAAYFADGATTTAYHFLLEWAAGEQYSWVDFQGCEPFLRKGTFQAKSRLGAALSHASGELASKQLKVTVVRDSPSVRAFLAGNPVVLVDEDGNLGVGYFWDGDHPPQRDVPAAKNGVHFTREINLDIFLARAAASGEIHGVE